MTSPASRSYRTTQVKQSHTVKPAISVDPKSLGKENLLAKEIGCGSVAEMLVVIVVAARRRKAGEVQQWLPNNEHFTLTLGNLRAFRPM
jgi:hypothetical protein